MEQQQPCDVMRRVLETARRYRMWAPGDRVVVAVSGGPDSVALLHVLNQLKDREGLGLVVAHLNHRLRGPAADEDAAFVRDLADRWGLPAVVEEADVAQLARRRGLGIQEAAREARYAFFARAAEAWGAARIALAHHADDQVETVLFRLLRGTGTRGLAGIPPVRGPIIRPLIDVPREAIVAYCHAHGLPYRVDPSNRDMRYRRNRIRWELIPLLEERYNPRVREAIARMARILRDEDDFLDHYADHVYRSLAREVEAPGPDGSRAEVDEVFIPRGGLAGLHRAVQRRVLRRALSRLRVPGKSLGWDVIDRLLTGGEGVYPLPGRAVARIGPLELHLYRQRPRVEAAGFDFPAAVPGVYRLEGIGWQLRLWREDAAIHHREGLQQLVGAAAPEGEPGVWEAAMAWEAVRPPLRLRSRQPGDRIQPLGFQGTRKLQDLFVDLKIPRQLRDQVPLLVDQEGILCVVGYRIAERARIGAETREVLRLRCQPLSVAWEPGAGMEPVEPFRPPAGTERASGPESPPEAGR